jgi:pimeloyl-ACP methyl ester carboxylesterase
MDQHIARLEALLSFLIRSLSPLDANAHPIDLLPYEYRKKIALVEEEIAYAMRLRRNLESLRQMDVTKYSTPERFTYINNNIVRYLDYGSPDSDKILILLHGLGGSAERWSRVIPNIVSTKKDFRVIIPDIIGFGYSDKPRDFDIDYSMDFFVEGFLRPFLDNLHISKASIIGSSFGGHIATEFAIRFNYMVEKLILVSPAGMMKRSTPTLDKYLKAAFDPERQRVYDAFREMVYNPRVVNEKMVRDFMNRMRLPNAMYAFNSTLMNMVHAPELRGRVSNITAPSLIVWGEKDSMIPLAENANEYNGIPNKILRNLFVVIKKCGHLPPIEKPSAFSKIVLKCI